MTTKKYELVKSDSIFLNDKTLYRIRALKDFDTNIGKFIVKKVKKNDLGGYVESKKNLSQEGTCWIQDNAKVYDNAKILNDAQVFGNAKVHGDSSIFGDAVVCDNAEVFDNAGIYENAKIFGDSIVFGNAKVHGDSSIFGDAVVCNKTEIFGDVEVSGNAIVSGIAKIGSNQKIKSGEYMYDAVDMVTLLPKVQDIHKQVLRIKMYADKYLIDENYLNNIIKEFNKYDKARKVKEDLLFVYLPLKSEKTCVLLEEINNALEEIEKIEKSKRFNKEVDNQ